MSFVIAISGRGQAGKGTFSGMLTNLTTLRCGQSTSQAMAEMVYRKSEEGCFGVQFKDVQECWDRRSEFRKLWGELIAEYNRPHGITLYQDMLERNDILDGIRRLKELNACREHGIVDLTIWIERAEAPEDASLDYGMYDCDIAVMNNGTLEDLAVKAEILAMGLRNLILTKRVCKTIDGAGRLGREIH